ncbi:MAG: DUF91 domain-containing protein [Dehalococcoidia bacterium]|nr:DUF91 domain-containing protein [Dehalococcoidia bacterium]MSQ17719.1 DUF91 domain-containing protein [Dehalococcoidia bacterium]
MVLKKIEIKEKEELEPILFTHPDLIEDGMRSVEHQIATPTGPLDLLLVDEGGSLCVVELKN